MTDTSHSDLAIPASVYGYLHDPAIRAGIEALLDVKPGALPPELGFDEFGDYLSARAAAELCSFEWPIMLLQLWNAVWKPVLSADWRSSPLDEMMEEGLAVTPAQCWDDGWLQFYHHRGEHVLYTLVCVDVHKTTIGFSIETETEALFDRDVGEFVWRTDDDWAGWLTFSVQSSPGDPDFDLAVMQEQASRALKYVNEAIAEVVTS